VGGHNVVLVGDPDCGKTMLARHVKTERDEIVAYLGGH
jgi:MoxR-like ATPase